MLLDQVTLTMRIRKEIKLLLVDSQMKPQPKSFITMDRLLSQETFKSIIMEQQKIKAIMANLLLLSLTCQILEKQEVSQLQCLLELKIH